MEVVVLDTLEGNVIARGSYHGGSDYEFIVSDNGQVYFHVVGDSDKVWAGQDVASFRQIAAAWNRYRTEVVKLSTELAQLERVSQMRAELDRLGAFPDFKQTEPEPLWSLLVFEAENGLG